MGRNTPDAAAMINPLALTMVFVGLLQSLALWALASRWTKISLLYGALGDRERAFQCLEKAVADHNEVVFLMGVDWRYDNLRNDPRFPVLLRAIGLPA